MVKIFRSFTGLLSLIAIVLTGTVVLSGLVLSSSGVSADSSSATASVTVGSACTMTATVNTAHSAEISPGASRTGIGSTTLNTICNDAGGFAIYAVGYTNNEYGNNKMSNGTVEFNTGTGSSASNWNMNLSQITTGTYATTIDGGFGSYSAIPSTYTKVAHRDSATDPVSGSTATGSSISLTYGAYISTTQATGDYVGKVKFTLVHPANETPAQPMSCPSGYICYYPNSSSVVGTMGIEQIYSSSTTSARLIPSNYSKSNYGFAGWSDAYDYDTNPNAHFYGPQENITFTAGQYSGGVNNGLSLYAVWVKSSGTIQNWNGCSNLTPTLYTENASDETDWSLTANLAESIIALTDERDGDTYAIARLSDGNCWMIENMRIADFHGNVPTYLTVADTNNPLNDGATVTLKHNYSDIITHNSLPATSNDTYDADTSPNGWCTEYSPACIDQARIRTENTTDRETFTSSTTMYVEPGHRLYAYGNYYNWYSATAGRGTYDKTSGETEGDICPAGWHLPSGHATSATSSGEFGALSVSLGGYKNANNVAQNIVDSSSPSAPGVLIYQRFNHFPNNFVEAGYISGSGRGHSGYYMTASANNNDRAYKLVYSYGAINPGTNGSPKTTGASVRCLVSPSA